MESNGRRLLVLAYLYRSESGLCGRRCAGGNGNAFACGDRIAVDREDAVFIPELRIDSCIIAICRGGKFNRIPESRSRFPRDTSGQKCLIQRQRTLALEMAAVSVPVPIVPVVLSVSSTMIKPEGTTSSVTA